MLSVKLEHMAEYIGDPSLLGHWFYCIHCSVELPYVETNLQVCVLGISNDFYMFYLTHWGDLKDVMILKFAMMLMVNMMFCFKL
jgi:hypothetical protein